MNEGEPKQPTLKPHYVVLTGIPASGKTTLGCELGQALDLPIIDKDEILEQLFDSLESGYRLDRNELSRRADEIFKAQVEASEGAIIISFWMRPEFSSTSGTPTKWLRDLGAVVEVHCVCDPTVATNRFVSRSRHVGHDDAAKDPATIRKQFAQLSALGPLGIGRSINVRTDRALELRKLIIEIQDLLDELASQAHAQGSSASLNESRSRG